MKIFKFLTRKLKLYNVYHITNTSIRFIIYIPVFQKIISIIYIISAIKNIENIQVYRSLQKFKQK